MIDFDDLKKEGLLQEEEYASISWGDNPARVDYSLLYSHKFSILRIACSRISGVLSERFQTFCKEQNVWLNDYALYMSIKDYYGGQSWQEWPETLQKREKDSLEAIRQELTDEILFWKKVQFLFFYQWDKLKAYAEENNIKIIGDLPIYVSYDSADVWAHPEEFQLDENLCPIEVAGCPPDGFSADGQLWGNPIYDWAAMKKDGYSWWISRLSHALKTYDTVRIDHFRAFASYWEIPADSKTAKVGKWVDGPKMDLFNKIFDTLGSNAPIIAEDLGVFGDDVVKLLEDTKFPGMKVIQFGFDPNSDSSHLPHNAAPNSINYVGTHDNNTILGWLWEADESERAFALDYCHFKGDNWGEGGYCSASCRSIIEAVWQSASNIAIIALQDMCGFGSDARMNIPGVPEKNWRFRTTRDTIDSIDSEYFKKINALYRRMYPVFDK